MTAPTGWPGHGRCGHARAAGPRVSARSRRARRRWGLVNAAYYRLDPGDPRRYLDTTGCGNSLNVGDPLPVQLIMDSLRYWLTEMHVDGFRFDLALTLAARKASSGDGGRSSTWSRRIRWRRTPS